ncbi:flagellin, partial [Priestia megaterium]
EFDRIATNTSFNGNKFIATAGQTLDLQLSDVANDTLTITFSQGTLTGVGMTLGNLKGTDGTAAQTEIGELDTAIDAVSKNRADLGSYMNRLEYTVDNLANAKVNISDAKSRIEDLDMASAMSELTKNEILTQSSVSMLARANQAPQAILKLIG